MRCPQCNAWATPDMTACKDCGAALASGSVVEKYERQIRAGRERLGTELPELGNAVPAGIEADTFGVLNLLLLHAGYSPFRHLAVRGRAADLRGARLEIAAQPPVVFPKALPLAGLDVPGELDPLALEVDHDAFRGLDEAVRGQLELKVTAGGRRLAAVTHTLTVQNPNEWVHATGCEAALAGAVTPNAPAVADFLARLDGSFAAYQTNDPESARREVGEVYDSLGRLDLSYVGAPPSFEGTGQKVLFPDQVLAQRRGCCIDVAVLTAAVLERLGLNPLILFVRDRERDWGHALTGVWLTNVRARQPVLRDRAPVREMLAAGELLVWDPTTGFQSEDDPGLASAVERGRRHLDHFEYALDVAGCRRRGFKPVPRKA